MFIPGLMEETKQLVDGKVRFDINSNTISDISFRNTDLNFETTQLAGNTDFALEEYNLSVTDDDIEEIADLFLSLGRAPNGVYNFNFVLENENNTEIDQISETVEIFVPTFQWNSDYSNKCNFSIRVSEFRASDHSSLQEALEDYSVLPINSGYFSLSSNINSFQYPASGAGEIIPGHLYVWQIRRTYDTSNGLMEEFSPIFLFKVQDTQSVEPPVVSQDVNLENIKFQGIKNEILKENNIVLKKKEEQ